MAPKRGGSSIQTGGGGVITHSCSDNSGNFKQPVVIARLTIDSVALASFLGIFFLWMAATKRNSNVKLLLRWYSFEVLVGLTIVYVLPYHFFRTRTNT
jgi:hypothetical protein